MKLDIFYKTCKIFRASEHFFTSNFAKSFPDVEVVSFQMLITCLQSSWRTKCLRKHLDSHSWFALFCIHQHLLRNSEENIVQTLHRRLFVSVKRFHVLRHSLISLLTMHVEKSFVRKFSLSIFCRFQWEKSKLRYQF